MGCCNKSIRKTPEPAPYVPGEAGFVLVEYLGSDHWFPVTGSDTGTHYVFGVNRRRGLVDKFDAGTRACEDKRKLLKLKNGNGYLFRRVALSSFGS